METRIIERAKQWLSDTYDEETREAVREMLENNPKELKEAFYKDLEFGTGGLRGIMGAGTNRMNRYTVSMATQGLANYLKKMFPDNDPIKVAIAFDSRRNNTFFANTTADVLSANGIKVYLFDDIRPTPVLSFAIRHLNCQSGVVITASHNPPEYNGYKAYWDDGAQLIAPHDVNVVNEAAGIKSFSEVKTKRNPGLVEIIGAEVDRAYIEKVKSLSLNPALIKKHSDISIVYTPLHGTGTKIVPQTLREFGFENIASVPEQSVPDGNFPTVKSPNPEEHEALTMAIKMAYDTGAGLVMATDPDADRVGIAVRNDKDEFVLLNGNQTAALLTHYLLSQWKEKQKLTGNEFIVKTVVTSELIADIARKNGVRYYDTLTGFKYIAEIIRREEGKQTFIGGGEESYGFMIGDFVRDKDAVSSCCMIAETAAWAAEQGKSLFRILLDIYVEYGFYLEKLHSLVRKGIEGADEIQQIMSKFRNAPPESIAGNKVVTVFDYLTGRETNLLSGAVKGVEQPKSNVLQFLLEDGSKISVRPSGTEPKIKYYFSARGSLQAASDFYPAKEKLESKLEDMINDPGLS